MDKHTAACAGSMGAFFDLQISLGTGSVVMVVAAELVQVCSKQDKVQISVAVHMLVLPET